MNGSPSKELKEALENLEAYAAAGDEAGAAQLELQEGRVVPTAPSTLRKTIAMARGFLTSTFPALAVDDDVYQVLADSAEVVKKNAVLLDLWTVGTDEQRRFAAYAREAIGRFNGALDAAETSPPVKGHLFRFFYTKEREVPHRLGKIEVSAQMPLNMRIAAPSSTQYDPLKLLAKVAAKAPEALTKKVVDLRQAFLPVQARELFVMKAISLFEKNGIATHEAARRLVREGVINTTCDEARGIYTLTLAVRPQPNRLIEVEGSFMGRIPLPDSFHISLRVISPE